MFRVIASQLEVFPRKKLSLLQNGRHGLMSRIATEGPSMRPKLKKRNQQKLILALMRHTSCLNKFYHTTDDRNMKAKLFLQKCKDDYQLTRKLIRKPHKGWLVWKRGKQASLDQAKLISMRWLCTILILISYCYCCNFLFFLQVHRHFIFQNGWLLERFGFDFLPARRCQNPTRGGKPKHRSAIRSFSGVIQLSWH